MMATALDAVRVSAIWGMCLNADVHILHIPAGINCRALETLFEVAATEEPECSMTLSVSFLEVYNEAVRDLLVKDAAALEVSGIPAGQLGACVMTCDDNCKQPFTSTCWKQAKFSWVHNPWSSSTAHAQSSSDNAGVGADRIPGLTWHSVDSAEDIRTALKVP